MSTRAVRRRSLALTAVAAALPLTLLAGAGGPVAAGASGPDGQDPADGQTVTAGGRTVPQTSDGVVGPLAPDADHARRTTGRVLAEEGFRVSPGLFFREWTQTDARGRVRAHLLTANLAKAGLSLDYLGPDLIQTREPVKRMTRVDRAVAGINGDFFDISDTGAPLGVGVASGATLHGPAQNWNLSFLVGADGAPAIRNLPTETTIPQRPGVRITNVNGHNVINHGVGVYTPRWGRVPGYRVVDGVPRKEIRQVVIRSGRVVSNSLTVSTQGDVRGQLLLGRGNGADTLRTALPVGTRATVVLGTQDDPRVVVSGNAELMRAGQIVTSDDGEMHPRTAVGIDVDGRRLLLLVVDGRQETSRGYTMLEMARMMRDLGAEHALNLDGGGSSTLVARKQNGRLGVMNSPSDGQQRPVPNGLALRWKAP